MCDGGGESSGEFRGEFFFFGCERKRKKGEQERLFSFGIWILGHTGPGVSQSDQSEGGGWAGGPRRAD